jgi:hypothetical protein
MHENEFEKRVREKMDQLSFDPSDAVWNGVDKEINKEEKRRTPLFWFFCFLGLTLATGGYYYYSHMDDSHIAAATKQQPATEHNLTLQPAGKTDALKTDNLLKPAFGQTVQRAKKIVNGLPPENAKDLSSDKPEKASVGMVIPPVSDDKIPGQAEAGQEGLAGGKKSDVDSSAGFKSMRMAESKPAMDSGSVNKKKKEELKTEKSSSWQVGFTAGMGISNISPGLFKSANPASPAYYTAAPINAAAGTTTTNVSSTVNPGFSFSVGAFIGRSLSKRVSFSAGINYRYYSTVIHTGGQDSLSAAYPGPVLFNAANGFYQAGNEIAYVNQYHFLELPLAIKFQLNKSIKMPVVLEEGLSVSYLLSSNALYYDPQSNVYYKDNQLLNKTQLNTSTAIMVGFHIRQHELRLGPQFEYGLTNLMKSGAVSPEHLLYWGLKFSFIPAKK